MAAISNDAELNQAVEQLNRLYRALAALHRDVLPVSPSRFALMAEGPQDEIERLQQSIDVYTGLAALPERVEEHIGDLREIDLDNLSFVLRNAEDIREIRCTFEEDLLESAKEALDRRVQVTGIRRLESGRRVSPTLRIIGLEILDEGPRTTSTTE